MRVHEVVIVVAMLFAASNAAGSMARRDAQLKVSDIRTSSAPAAIPVSGREGEIVVGETNPCTRTAEYEMRCDPARPRALDVRPSHADRSTEAAPGSSGR